MFRVAAPTLPKYGPHDNMTTSRYNLLEALALSIQP